MIEIKFRSKSVKTPKAKAFKYSNCYLVHQTNTVVFGWQKFEKSIPLTINYKIMKKAGLFLVFTLLVAFHSFGQDQKTMLYSKDPQLAKNKKLVYDFWREVLEGGHLNLAAKYLLPTYIQHNPNVPTGRQGFINFFSKFAKPLTIQATVKAPLISIVAEGNLVVLSFKDEHPDPKAKGKKYTTTWFDMLRIENGKIAEHWDSALKE